MIPRRIDRLDRWVLRIAGAVVLLVGVSVLLHSTGALGTRRKHSPIIASPTAQWFRSNGAWVWPTIGVLLAILAMLCLWWVSAQMRSAGTSRIELERGGPGALTISSAHLADCVERDSVNQDGIEKARCRISTKNETVHVWLTLWIGPPYDVGRAIARVANVILPNLAVSLGGESHLPVRTHVTVETAETTASRLS